MKTFPRTRYSKKRFLIQVNGADLFSISTNLFSSWILFTTRMLHFLLLASVLIFSVMIFPFPTSEASFLWVSHIASPESVFCEGFSKACSSGVSFTATSSSQMSPFPAFLGLPESFLYLQPPAQLTAQI